MHINPGTGSFGYKVNKQVINSCAGVRNLGEGEEE